MKRIFVTGISQESNSFNPLKSTYSDFVITKGKQFREMPGVKVLIDAEFEVVESIWARAVPGGTLKFEDFMRLADEMLKPLIEDKDGFDGVFLPMHGALDVENIGSGEAYIVTRVREIVGPNVPISTALDMHANNMYTLIQTCNIVYGYRTAPHIDVHETHMRAAKLLVKAINEGVMPKTRLLRIPYVMPGENMMTASGIGKEIIEFLPSIEKEEGVWCASYFVGMVWIDCPQNGAAIVVSGLGDFDAGMEKAKELANFVWNNRHEFKYQGIALEPVAAMDFIKEHQGDGPVFMSDSADNITAGAAGDNALMLDLFLKHKIEKALFAAIIDPVTVQTCLHHQVGDVLDIEVGGAFDTKSKRVKLKGALIKKLTTDLEGDDKPNSCVLSYCGIDILLYDKRKPTFTEETLNEHGLTLADYNVIVVKQGYLEPEFGAVARHSALILTPGNCDQRVERLNHKKLRRPMYPIDAPENIPTAKLFEMS